MLIRTKYSQLHSVYASSFIHSFILHRGTVVCWKQGIKSWTSSPCLPFCDEFLHPHCLSRVGYSLLTLLLFSVNILTTAYTIQGCIGVSSSFSLILFGLLDDRYHVLLVLASPDTSSRCSKVLRKPLLNKYASDE